MIVALLVFVLVEAVGVGCLLLTHSVFLGVSVQIVTILALSFPVYAVWRRNREKNRDLVDGVRIWSWHWDLMTRQFLDSTKINPRLVTRDDVKGICDLANNTADHLAEAHARAGRKIEHSQPITDFISALRFFARNRVKFSKDSKDSRNKKLFITAIRNLQSKAADTSNEANVVYDRLSTRYGVPKRYYNILTSSIVGWIAALALIFAVLWLGLVLMRLLGLH